MKTGWYGAMLMLNFLVQFRRARWRWCRNRGWWRRRTASARGLDRRRFRVSRS
ncbi:hypothetical protein HanIR_Chr14g0706141 [Helianthus annuus]|nr:hypothetical protein HanIR_Chr14g0706141 [Helianthus annuus]